MQKFGLLSGKRPKSTIEYYRKIEYGVQEKIDVFPNFIIESLSVFAVLNFYKKQYYDGLK